jgi:hypothetical protein
MNTEQIPVIAVYNENNPDRHPSGRLIRDILKECFWNGVEKDPLTGHPKKDVIHTIGIGFDLHVSLSSLYKEAGGDEEKFRALIAKNLSGNYDSKKSKSHAVSQLAETFHMAEDPKIEETYTRVGSDLQYRWKKVSGYIYFSPDSKKMEHSFQVLYLGEASAEAKHAYLESLGKNKLGRYNWNHQQTYRVVGLPASPKESKKVFKIATPPPSPPASPPPAAPAPATEMKDSSKENATMNRHLENLLSCFHSVSNQMKELSKTQEMLTKEILSLQMKILSESQ